MKTKNRYQDEILTGFQKRHKTISPKFLYDEKGSKIFEQITHLKEYYPTHAETEILQAHAMEMAQAIGPGATLIEPGCGNCSKVKALLKKLDAPQAYVAMDISGDFLEKVAAQLQKEFPAIPILAVVGDYTESLVIPPKLKRLRSRRSVFFPGSTIGNMIPSEAVQLLKRIGECVGEGGGLLIGVDRKKSSRVLELAYDDPSGVTANFNYNLLERLNREFQGNFIRKHFQYLARYNRGVGRVEMYLVSLIEQEVKLAGQIFRLKKGEKIHTEDSYKYSSPEFKALAKKAGFVLKKSWKDKQSLFGVYYLERAAL